MTSRTFNPDPFNEYPATPAVPDQEAGQSWSWLYAPGQYELGLLHHLVSTSFAANRFVHYAANYGRARSTARFRLQPNLGTQSPNQRSGQTTSYRKVELLSTGRLDFHRLPAGATVSLLTPTSAVGPKTTRVVIDFKVAAASPTTTTLEVDVTQLEGHAGPPGIAVKATQDQDRWEARVAATRETPVTTQAVDPISDPATTPEDATTAAATAALTEWVVAEVRSGGPTAPHLQDEPVQRLQASPVGGDQFILPAPALGHLIIDAAAEPVISAGESRQEAAVGPSDARTFGESRLDLEPVGPGKWRSRHRLGMAHLTIHNATHSRPSRVELEATIRSLHRHGHFTCSDDELNRIWGVSAYTLRLCMQRLMIDGIRRDRMPWAGDQALSSLANAYTYADATIAEDSSTASGQPQHGYVNGISDYSLWWVINNRLLQRYFGDTLHPAQSRARHVDAFMLDLARHAAPDGLFRPATQSDGFTDAGAGSVFLDWGVTAEAGRDLTALQMLWIWALNSAADILDVTNHPGARRWRDLSQRATTTLEARAWDEAAGRWREYADSASSARSAYPNFLAALNGLHHRRIGAGVEDAVLHGNVGTPFMTAFALRAAGVLGHQDLAVTRIKKQWGAMLDTGASTFWEEFATSDRPYAMYGRPFGKSLCHAWSAGPAALLPELILGVAPVADGWREFAVQPRLGNLTWARAVIPVVGASDIVISAVQGHAQPADVTAPKSTKTLMSTMTPGASEATPGMAHASETHVTVDVPAGLTLITQGQGHTGPTQVTWIA